MLWQCGCSVFPRSLTRTSRRGTYSAGSQSTNLPVILKQAVMNLHQDRQHRRIVSMNAQRIGCDLHLCANRCLDSTLHNQVQTLLCRQQRVSN